MELQEDDYVVHGDEVLVAEHISTAGMVPKITRDGEGNVTAVCLVPTTGGNSDAYCKGVPGVARRDGCRTNVDRRLPSD